MEEWRDIKGFEGMYQVSNMGRVKSLARRHPKMMRSIPEKIKALNKLPQGYLIIDLYKDNVRASCKVHRLVAEAFIPNPYNKPQVNHINENKADNRVENLEWVTEVENMNAGTVQERNRKVLDKMHKAHEKCVCELDENGNVVRRYNSIVEAAKSVNRHPTSLTNAIKGNYRCAKRMWRYENERREETYNSLPALS